VNNQRYLKSLLGKKKKKPFHQPTPWLKIEMGLKTEMELKTKLRVLFPLEKPMKMLG